MYSEQQILQAKKKIKEHEDNITLIKDKIAFPDEDEIIEFNEMDIQLEQEVIIAIKKKYQID